jgi:succinate dehydrogenase assembly factor 1
MVKTLPELGTKFQDSRGLSSKPYILSRASSGDGMNVRHTGLQKVFLSKWVLLIEKDILALYRTSLRAIRAKPEVFQSIVRSESQEHQGNWLLFVRREFRRYEGVSKKDFATIEYLLRKGRKTLETYSQPGIKDIQI